MKDEELVKIHDCLNDTWRFMKSYGQVVYGQTGSNEFWERLTAEAEKMSGGHNMEFMDELLLLCIYDIEQRHNHQNQSGVMLPAGRQLDNAYKRLKKRMENTS